MKEETCPVCGKVFIVPYHTIYKVKCNSRILTLCGWNCYNKALSNPKQYMKKKEKSDD